MKRRPLSSREARVLAFMELRAREPITAVARHCGMQSHTVHYALRTLRNRGIIRDVPVINSMAVGYLSFGIYFSVRARVASRIRQLLATLASLPEVVWLAELGGEYQIGVGVCVQSAYRLQEVMVHLSEQHALSIHEKEVVLQWSETILPRRYLHEEGGRTFAHKPLFLRNQGEAITIDDIDKRILSAMTTQGDASLRELATALGLAASTVEWRIKRLKERGVLVAYVLDIDASQLGRQQFIIQLFARGLQESLRKRLVTFSQKEPAITAIYSCLGAWDFELNVEAHEPSEISIIMARLLDAFSEQISHVKVISVARVVKRAYTPF